MKFNLKEFDWYSFLTAIVMLIVGLVILIWPEVANRALAYTLSSLVALLGLVRTFFYFKRHESASPFSFGGLTLGLTLMAIGVFLLFEPEVLIGILPVLLGALLIFSGFGSLQTAVSLMGLKIQKWYVPLIFSVLALACGFVSLFNPFGTAKILMIFLGIAIAGEGVLMLVSMYLFRKHVKGVVVETVVPPGNPTPPQA